MRKCVLIAVAVSISCFIGLSAANAQRLRTASGGLSIIHSLLWAPYEQKLQALMNNRFPVPPAFT